MPRHLQRALDEIAAVPVASSDEPRKLPRPLDEYVFSLRNYHALGIPIAEEHLGHFAALWKSRVDLRPSFAGFVLHYPCAAFHRAFRREFVRGVLGGDVGAWLRAYPELREELRLYVVERAGRFNQTEVAVDAALEWARHFGGGDEAYRAAANAIHRDDRRRAKRAERSGYASDGLRHDLEDHGMIHGQEAEAINQHLLALGTRLLDYGGMNMWWHCPPIDWERQPSRHGSLLAWAAAASHAYAGPCWGEEDEAFYAERLARLPPPARSGFWTEVRRTGKPLEAMRRIRTRAEDLAPA